MPMAAMMMRNKMLSWFAVCSATISILGSSHGAKQAEGAQSPFLQLLMAAVGVVVCYIDIVFPTFAGVNKSALKATGAISETIAAATAAATGA